MKNFIEIQKISFESHVERTKCENYVRNGLYISELNIKEGENVSDLVFVDMSVPSIFFICPAGIIKDMGIIEEIETDSERTRKETSRRKSLEAQLKSLEEHVTNVERDSNILRKENLELRYNTVTPSVPEYHSTLEQSTGTVSESFVLELTKILTQKIQ